MTPVTIIGASGRSGLALCRALLAAGTPIIPIVRNPAKWHAAGLPAAPRIADLRDPAALAAALAGAERVVSCAHARHTAAILAALPPGAPLIALGSTRRFTKWPDAHGAGVIAGETAFLASGRAGVMLHPTMIYGAQGEDNVQRLARLLARLPVLPLPGGGRALVQPIHQDDVIRCILAALEIAWTGPRTLVIAGPAALPYAEFVAAIGRAAGLAPRRVVALPAGPLMAAALATRAIPRMPTIRPAEIRRLLEDKAFDVGPMRATLGVEPIPLEEGLARTFARPDTSLKPASTPCPSSTASPTSTPT